jgi:hypothetical protein
MIYLNLIKTKIISIIKDSIEYGFVNIFKNKNKCSENIFSYNIGFAILSYERPEYLRFCLSTLYKTDISNIKITFFIIDDGSVNKEIKQIINNPSPVNFKVHRLFELKGKNNAGAAINRAIKIMKSYDRFDIVGWADPDCLFHPQWLIKTLKICLWAKNNHKQNLLGPFTSFNSSDHDFHKIKGTYSSPFGNYVVKRQAGMLNYFMFIHDWEKYGPFEESDSDETTMTNKLSRNLIRNISTETSYVEHIGQDSILNIWRENKINRAVYGMKLAKLGWTEELNHFKNLGFYKDVLKNVSFGENVFSNEKLDIFIPCTIKDLDNLPLCIEGIKKNLAHPIGTINVVAPDDFIIKKLCNSINVNFIDEKSVISLDKKTIKYSLKGYDRSGWLYQQILKYSLDEFTLHKNYLVVDSDTILIRPQKYEHNGKLLLQVSDEFHKTYFDVYSKITKLKPTSLLSSVAHSMIFNKKILKELKHEISKVNNKNWIEAIIENTDKNDLSGFSEYETYGLWTHDKYNSIIYREYFFNKFLSTKKKFDLESLTSLFGKQYKSVSIHKYKKK